VLSILLYGSESWSMTEKVLDRLRVFHARCVRAMSRVSRKHTWSEHIQTQQLEQELGLETIDLHVKRRQLRWLGHVRLGDAAPNALIVGQRAAAARRATDDLRPQHHQGARDVQHRRAHVARARGRPRRMARDAARRQAAAGLRATTAAAAGGPHPATPRRRRADQGAHR